MQPTGTSRGRQTALSPTARPARVRPDEGGPGRQPPEGETPVLAGRPQPLLAEARDFLERVTQMEAPPIRHGWAWRDLGRVFHYLEQPAERDRAYQRAMELLPEEPRLGQEWERYRTGRGHR